MYILKANIQIGQYEFQAIHEVETIKSIETLSDTAIIKLPTKFKLRNNNEVQYAEQVINVGDVVKITLAYEGKYEGVEFRGFVSKINPKFPIEIECEDAIWLLKRKNITHNFGKTTLKKVLQKIVEGTGVELAENIHKITFDTYIVKNKNGGQVLQDLKKMGFSSYINDEGKLYCGLQQINNIGQEVKYDLNYNIVSNDLEYKAKESKRLKIRYTYLAKNNKKKTIEVGDSDGELRTFHTSQVSDEAQLKAMAEAELEKLKYDGFEGSVTSFLLPFATRGMAAIIEDKEHENRNGKYIIKSVKTTFGMSGARREIKIGNKL